ncbi:extensin-like domain-containing protein [Xanthobacter sp. TB0136]|uniref:extensin-like domain-containing protein n=1 Tax=Xanthobacter sp. TB0136 TaxID=3459177 RepID=UPI0040394D83
MMRGISWYIIAPILAVGLLSGCRFGDNGRAAWRTEAEEQCLAEKGVVPSAFMEPLPRIDGKGACGMVRPFRVHALMGGNVAVEPAARMACPAIRETDRWMAEVVQPAAEAWLGQPITAVKQMSSYSCRTMNGQKGANISEHAFGNALDIGAFRTADGRWITVKNGWKGKPEEQGFLRQVHAGACDMFTTVLSPGSNIYHYDHIHFDLKRHAKGRSYCNPKPQRVAAPMAPPPPAMPAPVPVKADPPPVMPPYAPPVYDEPYAQPPAPPMQSPPADGLPPGWMMGPEGYPVSGPMSYAPQGQRGYGPFETGSIKPRREYYITPTPQPSTIPLPRAEPGED